MKTHQSVLLKLLAIWVIAYRTVSLLVLRTLRCIHLCAPFQSAQVEFTQEFCGLSNI